MGLIQAGYLLGLLQVGGIAGRLGWGIVSDRIGARGPAMVAAGIVVIGLVSPMSVMAQPAAPPFAVPSVSVDPALPGASPHWTITLFAQYCGGYRIGDGVYVSPEAPLALPATLPDGSVLFAGGPASVTQVGTALRVAPAPGLAQSMVCTPGDQPLAIELLPQAGFGLPNTPGTYAVDLWTGAQPTPVTVAFDVPSQDPTTPDSDTPS